MLCVGFEPPTFLYSTAGVQASIFTLVPLWPCGHGSVLCLFLFVFFGNVSWMGKAESQLESEVLGGSGSLG